MILPESGFLVSDSVGGIAGALSSWPLFYRRMVKSPLIGEESGTINFVSTAVYAGVPGNIFTATSSGDQLVITITDPALGIGVLTSTTPSTGAIVTVDFVATFSKSTGKVIRLNGHRTNADPTTHEILFYDLERQFQ